jgi:hypothetical protein
MSREFVHKLVLRDFDEIKGRVLLVSHLTGYKGDDSIDIDLTTPAKVRVSATPESDLFHQIDDWVDPYWNLELVEPHPELADVRSLWMFGHSYSIKGVDPARFEELPSPAPASA